MKRPAFILILSSDEARGARLGAALRDRGHASNAVATPDAALESVAHRPPDVVIVLEQPPGVLRAIADALHTAASDAAMLVVPASGDSSVPRGGRVSRLTAAADELEWLSTIDHAAEKAVARREDRALQASLEARRGSVFEGIVGASAQIRRTIDRIQRAAGNKMTVLIIGETGTGKELIARAIHNTSERARKAFKALNCAGVSESLLESELFGHVRGAFTGAVADRKGFFAAADGGTLFLDEIGDMPPQMQSRLLRVLDNREVTPVGSTDVIKVDVRLVAATNKDLREAVDKKEFRADLYYRLHGWEIRVPPLRERREDIPLLVDYLLQQANSEHGVRVPGVSSEAMNYLARYLWPGNVRQMRSVMAALACEVVDRQIEVDDLPEEIRGSRELAPVAAGGLIGLPLEEVERMLITRTLEAAGGNREQAAKSLGIGIRTLYRKIKEYGL